jgi:NhaP-type Na+/H+ or K+/H+ antiporter
LSRFILEQLGYGALVGVGLGLVGGWLLNWAKQRHWIAEAWLPLGLVALPLLGLMISEGVAASMFIAAFVAGLAVQRTFKEAGKHCVEFTEQWGQLLNLSVFFLFGMLVARAWGRFELAHWIYALISLTVVRMVPVAIALAGTHMSRSTVLFMGWFGPRGLASIVLGLVYLEETHAAGSAVIPQTVMATVLLSIFAHGMSARPGISIYARKVAALDAAAPEREDGVGGTDPAQPGVSGGHP